MNRYDSDMVAEGILAELDGAGVRARLQPGNVLNLRGNLRQLSRDLKGRIQRNKPSIVKLLAERMVLQSIDDLMAGLDHRQHRRAEFAAKDFFRGPWQSALDCGWEPEELFSCFPSATHWLVRYDYAGPGTMSLLTGNFVNAVEGEVVTYDNALKHRKAPLKADASTIWNLSPESSTRLAQGANGNGEFDNASRGAVCGGMGRP